MPVKVQSSGSHTPTVKVTPSTISSKLNSVRPQATIHPQKGTQNPPHWHVSLKSLFKPK